MTQEQQLLDAVRGGSEDAFRRIVEDHRAELHAHCYRMLGSLHDAEDALQDTLLRAWRGLPGFGGRSSLRSWLYRIATNACMDAIARRPKRVLPIDYGPPSTPTSENGQPLLESVWVEPYPDEALELADGPAAPDARYEQREAVELAFIASLQHLPATQRAVLILRDVLGFSAREVSESLETTVVSVNSTLQRARTAVAQRLPSGPSRRHCARSATGGCVRSSRPTSRRGPGPTSTPCRALLAEDAVFSMPPWPICGRAARRSPVRRDGRAGVRRDADGPTRANGQLAVASYGLDSATGRYEATAIDVFTLEGPRIKEITAFVTPEVFPRFGLPAVLAS